MSSPGIPSESAFQPAFRRVEDAIGSAVAEIAALPVTRKAVLTIDLLIVIERALGSCSFDVLEESE